MVWDLHNGKLNSDGTRNFDAETIQCALLMDVRDEMKSVVAELKRLNGLLSCPNFTQIPTILRGIRRNTAKRRAKRKTISER